MQSTATHVVIPAQRLSGTCPPWCHEKHHGEAPGQRSHWAPTMVVRTASTPEPMLVDLNQVDGEQPLIVVLDGGDDNGRNLTLGEALKLSAALVAMVGRALLRRR